MTSRCRALPVRNGHGAGPASSGKAPDDQQEREQELEQATRGEEHDSGGGYVPADVGDPEQIADDPGQEQRVALAMPSTDRLRGTSLDVSKTGVRTSPATADSA